MDDTVLFLVENLFFCLNLDGGEIFNLRTIHIYVHVKIKSLVNVKQISSHVMCEYF